MDASGLPSTAGFLDPTHMTPEQQRAEKIRRLTAFINQTVDDALKRHPQLEQHENASDRQQLELEELKLELARVRQQNLVLQGKLSKLEARSRELGNKEQRILNHVADVSAQARSINAIGNAAFAAYEPLLEDVAPLARIIGKYLTGLAEHIENARPHAYSYSDGADIDDLLGEPDRRRRTRYKQNAD